jgi:tetratricopeptide (TPR) repeat protein
MYLSGERLDFGGKSRRSNPWRVLVYLLLIVGGIQLTRMVEAGKIQPVMLATPLPTRTAFSYIEEGRAFFSAGDLEAAIRAYRQAAELEPHNARIWAELARIQAYSSELLANPQSRLLRLTEAQGAADKAVELSPDDSFAHAIRALAYDWAAAAQPSIAERERLLTEAATAALRANQLDPEDPLALAFYAEVLTDQQKWSQALDFAEQAVERMEGRQEALGDLRMDIYRVHAIVLESLGLYRAAIEQYLKAAEITPNLTFLYLRIGANYRQLGVSTPIQSQRAQFIDLALQYFNRAVQINAQINEDLRKQDPVPYLAIGKTYLQDGEFFAAALNIAKALAINPADPDVYGRLGIVYYKARNYESAIPVLKCAVEGCTAEESQAILCELGYADCESENAQLVGMEVQGLPLGPSSLEYYYTYGSALAFYSGSELYPNGCQEAERIFGELMGSYGDDPVVAGIVAENREICARVGGAGNPTPEAPQETPRP